MATGTKRQKATGTTHLLVLVPSGWGVATGFNQTFFKEHLRFGYLVSLLKRDNHSPLPHLIYSRSHSVKSEGSST